MPPDEQTTAGAAGSPAATFGGPADPTGQNTTITTPTDAPGSAPAAAGAPPEPAAAPAPSSPAPSSPADYGDVVSYQLTEDSPVARGVVVGHIEAAEDREVALLVAPLPDAVTVPLDAVQD